jgi:hypothetical protein
MLKIQYHISGEHRVCDSSIERLLTAEDAENGLRAARGEGAV